MAPLIKDDRCSLLCRLPFAILILRRKLAPQYIRRPCPSLPSEVQRLESQRAMHRTPTSRMPPQLGATRAGEATPPSCHTSQGNLRRKLRKSYHATVLNAIGSLERQDGIGQLMSCSTVEVLLARGWNVSRACEVCGEGLHRDGRRI